MLEVCLGKLATHGRVVSCGAVAGYEGKTFPIVNHMNLLARQARWEAFSYYDVTYKKAQYQRAIDVLTGWVATGAIKHDERIFPGLESFVPALQAVYEGKTMGKVILSIPKN